MMMKELENYFADETRVTRARFVAKRRLLSKHTDRFAYHALRCIWKARATAAHHARWRVRMSHTGMADPMSKHAVY